jgi:uncharacterized membrane protein
VTNATTVGEIQVKGWKQAGKPSMIKPVIATIERGLVRKRLGTLSTEDQRSLRAAIDQIIG